LRGHSVFLYSPSLLKSYLGIEGYCCDSVVELWIALNPDSIKMKSGLPVQGILLCHLFWGIVAYPNPNLIAKLEVNGERGNLELVESLIIKEQLPLSHTVDSSVTRNESRNDVKQEHATSMAELIPNRKVLRRHASSRLEEPSMINNYFWWYNLLIIICD